MVSDGHRYAAHTPVQSQSALSCAGRAALLIGPHCGTNRKRFNWKPLKGRISHSSSILQSKQTTGDPKRGFTCLYLPKLWKAANRYPGKRSKSISAFPSWLERMGFGEFNSLRRRVFAMLFKRFELAELMIRKVQASRSWTCRTFELFKGNHRSDSNSRLPSIIIQTVQSLNSGREDEERKIN